MTEKTRLKNVEGFADKPLEAGLDNSEFKRAGVANPSFDIPVRSPKRHIESDDVLRDGAYFTGENIVVVEREQKVSAREHIAGNGNYRPTTYEPITEDDNEFKWESPQLLLSEDINRARTIIKCATGFIMVGNQADLAGRSGYFLAAGETLETEVQSAIYISISKRHPASMVTYWAERN